MPSVNRHKKLTFVEMSEGDRLPMGGERMVTPQNVGLAKEERRFFRVKFIEPIKGRFKPVDPEAGAAGSTVPEMAPILDLSTAGAKIRLETNPPLAKKVVVELSFDLDESSFADLRGEVVWSRSDEHAYACGIRFVGLASRQEQRLFRALNSYQIKKARYDEHLNKVSNLRYLNRIVNILELLPYPALLLSDERRIVAVNRPAEAAGIRTDRSCFEAVFGAGEACAHCRLDAALASEDITKLVREFNGRPHEFNWFHLESGYLIYCFRELSS